MAYPEQEQLLFAEFRTGEVYLYFDVPRQEFLNVLSVLIPRAVISILVFAIGFAIYGWDYIGVGIERGSIVRTLTC